MTVRAQHTVWCDASPHADGCPQWVGQEDSVREVSHLARLAGWVRRDGKDYSPDCAPATRYSEDEDLAKASV